MIRRRLLPHTARWPLAASPAPAENNRMCGRFTLRTPAAEVASLFDVLDMPALPPRYNVAPTQSILTIGFNAGKRAAGFMRWGLVPSWSADDKGGVKCINARSETIAERPAFRDAFRKRRCLIPVDGFFEWKAEGKGKQPYLFQRPDHRPFAFAGLWERWQPEEGQPLLTCCLATTIANGLTKQYHDRMPVILDTTYAFAAWLEPGATVTQLQALLRPAPDDFLQPVRVSRAVNNARFDGPECVEPLEQRSE
jgi:putative SOS response-associated peptidase YedK